MNKRLYVGNLPWEVRDDQLREIFSEAGEVSSAEVICYRDSGRSKGFGFVEMATEAVAQQAIETLNGKEIDGRPLIVNEARPMEEREEGAAPAPAPETTVEPAAEEAVEEKTSTEEVPTESETLSEELV